MRHQLPLRCGLAALTAGGLLASVTACGSAAPAAGSAPPPATRSAAPARSAQPAASSPAASASPASTPAPAARAARCTTGDLRIADSSYLGAALGHVEGAMTLTNTSHQTCFLEGFPGVELLSRPGRVIGNAARGCGYIPCATTPVLVTLPPGAVAHFDYTYTDVAPAPQKTCPQAATALVTPPDAYDHQAVPVHRLAPCGHPPIFGVGVVQDGPAPAS